MKTLPRVGGSAAGGHHEQFACLLYRSPVLPLSSQKKLPSIPRSSSSAMRKKPEKRRTFTFPKKVSRLRGGAISVVHRLQQSPRPADAGFHLRRRELNEKDSQRPLETVTPLATKLKLPIDSTYSSKLPPVLKKDAKDKAAKGSAAPTKNFTSLLWRSGALASGSRRKWTSRRWLAWRHRQGDHLPALHLVELNPTDIDRCAAAGDGGVLFFLVGLQIAHPAAQAAGQNFDFIPQTQMTVQ